MRSFTLILSLLVVGCKPADMVTGDTAGDQPDDVTPIIPADLDQDGRPDSVDLVITGLKEAPNAVTKMSILPSQRVDELYLQRIGEKCSTNLPFWPEAGAAGVSLWDEAGDHAYVIQHLSWDADGKCTAVSADLGNVVGLDSTIQVDTNAGDVYARQFLCLHSKNDAEHGDYTVTTGDHATCQFQADEADAALNADGGTDTGTTDTNVTRVDATVTVQPKSAICAHPWEAQVRNDTVDPDGVESWIKVPQLAGVCSVDVHIAKATHDKVIVNARRTDTSTDLATDWMVWGESSWLVNNTYALLVNGASSVFTVVGNGDHGSNDQIDMP